MTMGLPVIDVEGLIKRIPRPERSGFIAVVVMLMALWRVLYPSLGGVDCGYFSLYPCAVAAEEVTKEEKEHATPLYFGSGPGEAKDCHLDIDLDDRPVIHSPVPRVGHWWPDISEDSWYDMKVYRCPSCGVSTSNVVFFGGSLQPMYKLNVADVDLVRLRWHCPAPHRRTDTHRQTARHIIPQ
jgi:hypothetical protein